MATPGQRMEELILRTDTGNSLKLDSQNVYFLHIRNGVNGLVKELKNLQWTAEELRTGGRRKVRTGPLQGWEPASHLEPEFGRSLKAIP